MNIFDSFYFISMNSNEYVLKGNLRVINNDGAGTADACGNFLIGEQEKSDGEWFRKFSCFSSDLIFSVFR